MRVRAQRSAQGDLTRLDYVRCDKVRKVSYGELGLLVISVACQVVRCYDIGERSTNIEHCFVIPMRGHSPLHAIQREQPSKGTAHGCRQRFYRVSGRCHLCAPRLTQRQCMGSQCIANGNAKEGRRALGRWCCADLQSHAPKLLQAEP